MFIVHQCPTIAALMFFYTQFVSAYSLVGFRGNLSRNFVSNETFQTRNYMVYTY